MCDIGHFHTQTHRSDEPFQLDRLSRKVLSDESGLVYHSLPTLALVFTGLDDFEHLLFCDTSDFR